MILIILLIVWIDSFPTSPTLHTHFHKRTMVYLVKQVTLERLLYMLVTVISIGTTAVIRTCIIHVCNILSSLLWLISSSSLWPFYLIPS